MKSLTVTLFSLMVIIQLYVLSQMIWEKDRVLENGTYYKFETAPIDPNHPFIGKYIVLDYKSNQLKMTSTGDLLPDYEPVYVRFKVNRMGFAEIESITNKVPAEKDYLKTVIMRIEKTQDSLTIFVDFPFRKYYMEESKAPAAELVYQRSNIDTASKTYALVAVYKGDASVKDVYINDTAITEMVKYPHRIRTK